MQLLELRRPPGGAAPGSERETDSDTDTTERDERAIVCRRCGRAVSHADSRFAPTGAGSSFVFANPAGRVFEIITVRAIEGVITSGQPTEEHTWFAGFAWRAISCASCQAHLGWRFDAESSPTFWALITTEILEG